METNANINQSQPRASRVTDCISRAQAKSLRQSWDKAAALGQPLNFALTVHWLRVSAWDDKPVSKRVGLLLERLRHWLRYHKHLDLAALWTLEANEKAGSHVHIALHLPHGSWQPLAQRIAGWLQEPLLAEPDWPRSAKRHWLACGGSPDAPSPSWVLTRANSDGWFSYITKQIEGSRRRGRRTQIPGKRLGRTQVLGIPRRPVQPGPERHIGS